MKILVVAGTYYQYVDWCRDHGERPSGGRCVYVLNSLSLRGYGFGQVAYVLTGTYWERQGWYQIRSLLLSIGAMPCGGDDEEGVL